MQLYGPSHFTSNFGNAKPANEVKAPVVTRPRKNTKFKKRKAIEQYKYTVRNDLEENGHVRCLSFTAPLMDFG